MPGHSSPLLAAAAADRSNLATAASAALADAASGHHPDTADTPPAHEEPQHVDLPGQRPDPASGRHLDVIAEAVASLLTNPKCLDRLNEALEARVLARGEMEAEIDRLTAQMDPEITDLAAAVVGDTPKGDA